MSRVDQKFIYPSAKVNGKKSITIELEAYLLPFTLVNGLMELPMNGVLTPSLQLLAKRLIQCF